MKAIASEGKAIESKISKRGGRSPFYLIFKNKKLIKVMKNPFAVGGGGAGWGVAAMLEKENIKEVIAGAFGPNMLTALKQRKIKFQEAEGNVKDFV